MKINKTALLVICEVGMAISAAMFVSGVKDLISLAKEKKERQKLKKAISKVYDTFEESFKGNPDKRTEWENTEGFNEMYEKLKQVKEEA